MTRATEILPNTYRFEGERFYGSQVGTYLLNLPKQVVLIDVPAFRPDSVEFVRSFGKPINCIATHGSTIIGDSRMWQRELGVRILLHAADRGNEWLAGEPDEFLTGAETRIDRLRVIHTPGHSAGSVCILDHETKALFSGDTLAGTPSGRVRSLQDSVHDQDSAQRTESVQKLLRRDFTAVFPFHYSPILVNSREQIAELLSSYRGASCAAV